MKRQKEIILNTAKRAPAAQGVLIALAALWLSAGAAALAQSGTATGQSGAGQSGSGQTTSGQSAKPASSSDNPFPGDAPQAPAPQPSTAGQPASGQQTDGSKAGATPKKTSENPFPGEDTDAPIIPTEQGTAARPDAGSGANSGTPGRRDPDGDPVRSPDRPGQSSDAGTDDGFSSSLSGVNAAPAPDTAQAPPPVPVEDVHEDVNVGQFYLDRKNWRAAQARFAAAFTADKENQDAVWGLAEAERHLGMLKEADQHYKLFLTYDPTGPHGKAARKAMEEVEAELNLAGHAQK